MAQSALISFCSRARLTPSTPRTFQSARLQFLKTMAIEDGFVLSKSAQDLPLPTEPNAKFFILYLASSDPATKQPWCSDVRAALPLLNKVFSAPSSPKVHYVYVGSRAEYKDNPGSRFRTDWNINNIPALVRYQRVDEKVEEVGRLVEEQLLDEQRIQHLIGP